MLICLVAVAIAQSGAVLNSGTVNNVEIKAQQVLLQTENAYGEVSVYAPNIIRVRLDKKALRKEISFAVVAAPQTVKATISQTAAEINILKQLK